MPFRKHTQSESYEVLADLERDKAQAEVEGRANADQVRESREAGRQDADTE